MVESNKTAADTYSLAIFRAIRRLQQAAEIHSKRLSRYGGLTPLQLLILHVLAVEGELTATQLAKLVSLSQASLSGVLDRLEGRGLLYRRRDEQDRRKSWLHLDPAGHEALAEAPPLLPEYVIERFAALPSGSATACWPRCCARPTCSACRKRTSKKSEGARFATKDSRVGGLYLANLPMPGGQARCTPWRDLRVGRITPSALSADPAISARRHGMTVEQGA